jgi:hypothetical protein
MKAATERKIIRWIHLLLSIPIIGFIYGPVATIPRAAFTTRVVFVPTVVLSGLWLWQGHRVKKWFRKKQAVGERMIE